MASFLDKLKKRALKSNTNYQMNTAKKKKAVSGTMKGKQVDTTVGPNMSRGTTKKVKPKKTTAVKGTMKGKQVDTTKGPNMSRGTKVKKTMSANKTSPATKKRMADKKATKKKVAKRRGPSGPTMTSFR